MRASRNRSRSEPTVQGAAARATRIQRSNDEKRLEDALVRTLERRGIPYERRVITPCGIADVVTEDTVYEVKHQLTHDVLFKAVGQVTLYAASLSKPRRVLVGYEVATTGAMSDVIRELGIEINVVP